MQRWGHSWYSPALRREMPVARWGERGKPVLLFPTAGGDQHEVERFGLVGAVEELVERGRIRVYSIPSLGRESWMSLDIPHGQKAWVQVCYDRFLADELLPFLRWDAGAERVITVGASLGAYQSVNVAAKHPDQVWLSIAMSGLYDFDRFMDGYVDDNYYYNQPLRFVPNLAEGEQLRRLRESFFLVACGQGPFEVPSEAVRLGETLGARGIPNYVEMWGYDADHDWRTWRAMLPMFIDRLA
jgi:esterase/lipase superfamily enzyme